MIGQDLLLGYDILLVDLYGVIWSGTHSFPPALEALSKLISFNKKVSIVSNISFISEVVIKAYEINSLCPGKHSIDFVISGNVMYDILIKNKPRFKSVRNPKKYFMFGASNSLAFEGTNSERTINLDEANFIYVSAVRFSDDERNKMSDRMKQYLYVAHTHSNDRMWDSISMESFIPQLKNFLDKKKPIAIVNSDKTA